MILLILLLLLIYVEIIVSIPLKVKLLKSSSNIPYVPTNNNIEIAKPLKLPMIFMQKDYIDMIWFGKI